MLNLTFVLLLVSANFMGGKYIRKLISESQPGDHIVWNEQVYQIMDVGETKGNNVRLVLVNDMNGKRIPFILPLNHTYVVPKYAAKTYQLLTVDEEGVWVDDKLKKVQGPIEIPTGELGYKIIKAHLEKTPMSVRVLRVNNKLKIIDCYTD